MKNAPPLRESIRRFVRFREQPVKFRTGPSGDLIADVVPRNMASLFDDHTDAYNRAWLQWGDVGMEHCLFCSVDGDTDAKPIRAIEAIHKLESPQRNLL
jgi:hypothetical protein